MPGDFPAAHLEIANRYRAGWTFVIGADVAIIALGKRAGRDGDRGWVIGVDDDDANIGGIAELIICLGLIGKILSPGEGRRWRIGDAPPLLLMPP